MTETTNAIPQMAKEIKKQSSPVLGFKASINMEVHHLYMYRLYQHDPHALLSLHN